MSKHQKATQQIDAYAAQFIYGVVIQIVIFYVCGIWLALFPAPPLYFMHHTYLFSLYIAYKLPEMTQDKSEDLSAIMTHIQKRVSAYTKKLPIDSELHSIKYLGIIAALFHMPALFGILLTYIILAQNYGHTQTESLLHLPLVILCSIFTLSITSGYTLLFALALSPIIFTMMFSHASLLNPKEASKEFYHAKEAFVEKLSHGNTTDRIILFMIVTTLLMPFIQIMPYVSVLYPLLNAPPAIFLRFSATTLFLGERSQRLLSPAVKPENIDNLIKYAKSNISNAMPTFSSFFTSSQNASTPTVST